MSYKCTCGQLVFREIVGYIQNDKVSYFQVTKCTCKEVFGPYWWYFSSVHGQTVVPYWWPRIAYRAAMNSAAKCCIHSGVFSMYGWTLSTNL